MDDRDRTGPLGRPLYFSSEIRGDMRRRMGTAHYSYGIVAHRFASVARSLGDRVVFLDMPEKYKRRQDLERETGTVPDRPIHIAFRSTENLRPLAGAFNICHFAWEFDDLSDRNLASEPVTANQVRMLGLMDEIWVPSPYTARVLAGYGFSRVEVVPTPVCGADLPERLPRAAALDIVGPVASVPYFMSWGVSAPNHADLAHRMLQSLADQPAMQAALTQGGRIALSILNPGDRRKNLLNLIDGFLMGAGPNDVLLLKLAVPAEKPLFEDSPFVHLRPRYNGPAAAYHPRVIVISDYLRDAEMRALYSLADYYLSPAHCEGHNLPLLEAMAHGTLAVATANTAMGEYLESGNAVIIAERRYRGVVEETAAEVSGRSPMLAIADRFAIARALQTALVLDPDAVREKTECAKAMVLERFGEKAITDLFRSRLDAVAASSGESARVS